MIRFLLVLMLGLVLPACGTDNSSSVRFQLDGNGCLVAATDFDWTSEAIDSAGVRTVNYRWECADYTSPLTGRDFSEKRVTLTFIGSDCLLLTGELVGEGYCLQGKTPVN